MTAYHTAHKKQPYREIEPASKEFSPALLNIFCPYCLSVLLKPAEEGFCQG